MGGTTHYGSSKPDRKIPLRPPDPVAVRIAIAGGILAVVLLALGRWWRPAAPGPAPPDPAAAQRLRLEREVAARRQQFLGSLTPTPDDELEAVRAELVLAAPQLCATLCPGSAAGDCTFSEHRVLARESATLRVGVVVACGPAALADGSWQQLPAPVEATVLLEHFGGRWLVRGAARREPAP
jgi:hypothetical protein